MNTCEYNLHSCSSSDCEMYEPCGESATGKYKGAWYCLPHLDEMMDANSVTDKEKETA